MWTRRQRQMCIRDSCEDVQSGVREYTHPEYFLSDLFEKHRTCQNRCRVCGFSVQIDATLQRFASGMAGWLAGWQTSRKGPPLGDLECPTNAQVYTEYLYSPARPFAVRTAATVAQGSRDSAKRSFCTEIPERCLLSIAVPPQYCREQCKAGVIRNHQTHPFEKQGQNRFRLRRKQHVASVL